MYDTIKIDVFEFGAVNYVIETIYCFELASGIYSVLLFEINLN